MKNLVSPFLVCAALVGAAMFAPVAAHAQNLLLTNANYESDTSDPFIPGNNAPSPNTTVVAGWVGTVFGSTAGDFVGVASDQPASGKELLRFGYVSNASQETSAVNRASVTPGASYNLSFLARRDGGSGIDTATFSIAWYGDNAAGNYTPLSSADLAVSTGASTVMLPFSLTATAPTGATFAAVRYSTTGGFLGDAFVLSASPAVVPEAGTLPLVLGAVAAFGAGVIVRRRK